jgi:hypothetical protein
MIDRFADGVTVVVTVDVLLLGVVSGDVLDTMAVLVRVPP